MKRIDTIIHQITDLFNMKLESAMKEMLEKKIGLTEAVSKVKSFVDDVGLNVIRSYIQEIDRNIKASKERKREWVVERKDVKRIVTLLGEVEYEKTYYRSKKDGRYKYLVDEVLGISKHERIDKDVKLKLAENSADMSYEKSGHRSCPVKLSKQSAFNAVREIGEVEICKKPKKKKEVKVIYVEADEDHVSLQNGKKEMVKLVYIHDGIKKRGGRNALKNAHYEVFVGEKAEDIWLKVLNYIDDNYKLDKVERIYIAGDGANWIKKGLEWIPASKFVLDMYHLGKYITKASSARGKYDTEIWDAIHKASMGELEGIFKRLLSEATSKRRLVKNFVYLFLLQRRSLPFALIRMKRFLS